MGKVTDEISTSETGSLGVLHLKRFWSMTLRSVEGIGKTYEKKEASLNRILLNDLGTGFTEPNSFLIEKRPTFEEFENWIKVTIGGEVPQETVDRTNQRIRRFLAMNQGNTYPLPNMLDDPVLSEKEMRFWEKNGYVVLREAISKEDAKDTEAAIWQFNGMNPEEPQTWKEKRNSFWVPMYQHPTFKKNRESKRIRKAFAQLWGTNDLICNINRASMNFPLDSYGMGNSGPSNLHWDISLAKPLAYDVLGIIYLTDTTEEQGAFQCIPGFHHHIEKWLQEVPADKNPRDEILKKSNSSVHVAAKAGDLILCRQELPHGSSPNTNTSPRVCQYISFFPPDFPNFTVWE